MANKGKGSGNSPVSPKKSTLGTTSRAYSIAHPTAEQDYAAKAMAYQNSTKANTASKDYADKALAYMAATDRNRVAAASAPSAAVTEPPAFSATGINIVDPQQTTTLPGVTPEAVAPVPVVDPIEEAYKKYVAGIEANRATNTSDTAGIKSAIQGYYAKAAEGNKQTIGNSQNEVDASAKALGVDFNTSREGQLINAGARDRQEGYDSMQAHNLSSVDKASQLQGGVYDAYTKEGELLKNRSIAERTALELQKKMQLQQIQADIEAAMAVAASAGSSGGGGGGGGGRRSGGGSGSSSGSTTIGEGAEEVSYVNNIGDVEALNALSPSARSQFLRIYNLGGGDVTSALSEGQKLFDAEQSRPIKNTFSGVLRGLNKPLTTVRNAKKGNNLNTISQAMNALTGISGILGTPTTRQKVTTTSKKNTKK